ncbi:MAG: GreA/GreB family elongation factor [Gemmatimonadota bacterium]|nr:GreA/GreB family elongation factor [Gemmatimonadota bacterium]
MLDHIRQKLADEAEALLHELNVILPLEIEKAVAQGDLRENSEYSAALERQGFVSVRLDYLARRMSQLGEIDVENIPMDRVGFGSRVQVKDDDGEIEEFSITIGDDLDFDKNEISMESPLGRALLGKRPGDVVTALLPAGARELEVVAMTTWHEVLKESA